MQQRIVATPARAASGDATAALRSRLRAAGELVIDKAFAHRDAPQRYPLPADAKAPERRLAAFLERLPERTVRAAASRRRAEIESDGAERRQRLGDLDAVNLRSAVAVAQQVRATPFPAATHERLTALAQQRALRPAARAAADGPQFRSLEARLTRLRCIEKTRVFGEIDFKDEMAIEGIAIAGSGAVTAIERTFLGKFKTGDARAIAPPLPLGRFPLTPASFPNETALLLQLIEAEFRNLPDSLFAGVGVMLAVGAAGLIFPPFLPLVGPSMMAAFAGTMIGTLAEMLHLDNDDPYPTRTVAVTLAAAGEAFDGGATVRNDAVRTERKHGEYEMTVQWRLIA